MGNAFVRMVAGSSARRLALVVVLSVVIGTGADAILYASSSRGIDPAQLASQPLTPRAQVTTGTCATAYASANPVATENTCAGTTAWQQQKLGSALSASGQQVGLIQGFPVPDSVNVGGSLRLYVDTQSPTYAIHVYRLGWYGGAGGHLLYTSPPINGTAQPTPLYDSATRTYSCSNWTNPATISIPRTWVSGVYEAQFVAQSGAINNTLFVVRNDASHAPVGVLVSLNTYQAYNAWGGHSLYGNPRGYAVSYDRPYDGPLGLGNFVFWDADAIRWMERQSYNLTYLADMDLDQNSALATQHSLMVVPGHSEYWSGNMRHTLDTTSAGSTSWAFLGANNVFWHVRTAASPLGNDRIITCYKSADLDPLAASQPGEATVEWRDPPINSPELNQLGQMYAGIASASSPLTLTTGIPALLANTGLSSGMSLPGLVGGEYDNVRPNVPTSGTVTEVAVSSVTCKPGLDACNGSGHAESDATLYTTASGARVFDAGSFQWGWGLDGWGVGFGSHDRDYSNTAFEKFNANLFAYLLHEPLPGAEASATPVA